MTKLTRRQEEVLDLLLEGVETDEIADTLGITQRAVQRLIARACVANKVRTPVALAARMRRKRKKP